MPRGEPHTDPNHLNATEAKRYVRIIESECPGYVASTWMIAQGVSIVLARLGLNADNIYRLRTKAEAERFIEEHRGEGSNGSKPRL